MPSFTFQTRIPLPERASEFQERLRTLFAIRDELDREIETLMGRRPDEPGKLYHCVRCDYKWKSRLPHRPRMCPKCRAKKFDSPPLYTYEEKVERKKERLRQQYPAGIPTPMATPPISHSVLTRQVSLENDSIQNVALTPPPVPGTINPQPLSLRERLAQMNKGGDLRPSTNHLPDISNGAATDGAHLEQNESVTEDELVEAINGEDDAT